MYSLPGGTLPAMLHGPLRFARAMAYTRPPNWSQLIGNRELSFDAKSEVIWISSPLFVIV